MRSENVSHVRYFTAASSQALKPTERQEYVLQEAMFCGDDQPSSLTKDRPIAAFVRRASHKLLT